MSFVDDLTNTAAASVTCAFSAALDVEVSAVRVARALASQDRLMLLLDFYRRSHFRRYMANTYKMTGNLPASRRHCWASRDSSKTGNWPNAFRPWAIRLGTL